jgi:hypothetical protein
MKPRVALWALSLSSVYFAPGWTSADQISPSAAHRQSFTTCKVDVGCAHFEGYVVVQRRPEADVRTPARPDAELSANRLYLSTEDDKTP